MLYVLYPFFVVYCVMHVSILLLMLFHSSVVDFHSVLWYCWLGLLTCKNRRPYNVYCVGADVKPCSVNKSISSARYTASFSQHSNIQQFIDGVCRSVGIGVHCFDVGVKINCSVLGLLKVILWKLLPGIKELLDYFTISR